MGFGKSLKKIGKGLTGGAILGGVGSLAKNLFSTPKAPGAMDAGPDQAALDAYGSDAQNRLQQLADQQRGQINEFGNQFQSNASDYRNKLAASLAQTGQQTFQQANPYILEDLHSRGLASSPTTVAQEQSRALQDIALKNQGILSDFDTSAFNQLNDIKGAGLNTFLGGNQDALDQALETRRAGLQRSFDVADQNRQQSYANYLAKRQSRDQLIQSLIGGGFNIASAGMGKR